MTAFCLLHLIEIGKYFRFFQPAFEPLCYLLLIGSTQRVPGQGENNERNSLAATNGILLKRVRESFRIGTTAYLRIERLNLR